MRESFTSTTEATSNQAAHSTLLFNIPDARPDTSPACALAEFPLQLTHKCCHRSLAAMLLVATCYSASCKPLHCGVPGQWRTSLPSHHLHS